MTRRFLFPVGFLFFGCTSCVTHTVDPSTIEIPESGVTTSSSGLIKKILSCPDGSTLDAEVQRCLPGSGTLLNPGPSTKVTVHYSGWTTDGVEFDSSVRRNEPATFPLNGVIQGWTEGLQTMVEGEKARFWIPEALAYKGKEPVGMLVFDVELISF